MTLDLIATPSEYTNSSLNAVVSISIHHLSCEHTMSVSQTRLAAVVIP
jgi:hypothetical protein